MWQGFQLRRWNSTQDRHHATGQTGWRWAPWGTRGPAHSTLCKKRQVQRATGQTYQKLPATLTPFWIWLAEIMCSMPDALPAWPFLGTCNGFQAVWTLAFLNTAGEAICSSIFVGEVWFFNLHRTKWSKPHHPISNRNVSGHSLPSKSFCHQWPKTAGILINVIHTKSFGIRIRAFRNGHPHLVKVHLSFQPGPYAI